MTTHKEALTALVHEMEYVLSCINADKVPFDGDDFHEALRLGKEALAQPEQEPVATVAEVHMSRYTIEWTNGPLPEGTKLYTTPPQRTWVGLTQEERKYCFEGADGSMAGLLMAIESKLKEKNT